MMLVSYYGPTGQPDPSAAYTQLRASRAARDLLATVHLPAGSRMVASDPSVRSTLHAPAFVLGYSDVVDAREFWRVPGTPTSVLSRLSTELSIMLEGSAQGLVTQQGPGREAAAAPLAGTVDVESRQLSVVVTRAKGGGSAVRIDGEAAWVRARAIRSRIPQGVTSVRITTGSSVSDHLRTRQFTLRDSSATSALVAIVDSLPARQEPDLECLGSAPAVTTLAFRSPAGATEALLRLFGSCAGATLQIGRNVTFLDENQINATGNPVGAWLSRYLGSH